MPAAIDLLASNYRLRGICQEGPGVAELQVLRPAGPFDKSLAISCHWEARTRSCSTPSRWDVETMGRRGPILDLDNGPREAHHGSVAQHHGEVLPVPFLPPPSP